MFLIIFSSFNLKYAYGLFGFNSDFLQSSSLYYFVFHILVDEMKIKFFLYFAHDKVTFLVVFKLLFSIFSGIRILD